MKAGPVYWVCQALIWINFMFYIPTFLSIIFECHPVVDAWNLREQGRCVNRDMILVVAGSLNVLSDLMIILLPIWAIWHLQMALKRKVGIMAVFATGLL